MGSRSNSAFVLHQATLSLWPVDRTGAVTGPAVWFGACAEQLTLQRNFTIQTYHPWGDAAPVHRHGSDQWSIVVRRLWVFPGATLADFEPARNQAYQMEVLWEDARRWQRQVYSRVVPVSLGQESHGILYSLCNQEFVASGRILTAGQAGVDTVPALTVDTVHAPGFFSEDPCLTDSYLQGVYRYTNALRLTSVSVMGRVSVGDPTVFTLEINGVLSSTSITLPAGSELATASASTSLLVAVPALADLRWKVTSAPADVADCATEVGLSMTLVPA